MDLKCGKFSREVPQAHVGFLTVLCSALQLLSKGNVFATDAIIATLMTSTRSIYSWDVVVQVC